MLSTLQKRILDEFQRNFPLTPRPYDDIAQQLSTNSLEIKTRLRELKQQGFISRIGPVFRPNSIGASTLAATSVPPRLLERVADLVSGCPEVNHNYERDHILNLWFVVTAESVTRRDAVISEIQNAIGYDVISLPLVRDYHIDLGFKIDFEGASISPKSSIPGYRDLSSRINTNKPGQPLDFISALQGGLTITDRPFLVLAEQTGQVEESVINRIAGMIEDDTIRRFGVVVRHHELGYGANAMCVWDVPDNIVDSLGEKVAKLPQVTLCYQRPRCLPRWQFNLFCMIHGKSRQKVIDQKDSLIEQLGIQALPHEVLFSGRRFKQRGAFYRQPVITGAPLNAAYG
jgi:DNA-binding Lrp family transcriptional regulator